LARIASFSADRQTKPYAPKAASRERLNFVLRAMLATAHQQKIPPTSIIVDVDAMSLS